MCSKWWNASAIAWPSSTTAASSPRARSPICAPAANRWKTPSCAWWARTCRWSGRPRVLGGVLIYVLFNLLLASGTRSLLERLLSRRRVRELLVFFLLMLWMVPRFVMLSGYRTGSLDGWSGAVRTVAWPWTAAAYAALGQRQWLALLSLICWT